MKEHIKKYKEKLEKSIGEYMENPISERSASAVKGMLECWECIDTMGKKSEYLTHDEAKHWCEMMENDDGSNRCHWTMEQTSAVADSIGLKFEHISEWCWWVTMNMMYSDYCKVAEKHMVNVPEFYADMAKAFLFDKDGGMPKHKLAAYYHYIVEK